METYHDKHEILSGRVLLYRRLDHKGMVGKTYQMRIKVPDRKGFIVLSTKTADLNEAIATATDRLAELTHKQRTGIPLTTWTFSEHWEEWYQRQIDRHTWPSPARRQWHLSYYNRYFKPFFGTKNLPEITIDEADGYWTWSISYWQSGVGKKIEKANPRRFRAKTISSHNAKKTPAQKTLLMEQSALNQIFTDALLRKRIHHQILMRAPVISKRDTRRPTFDDHEWNVLTTNLLHWSRAVGRFADGRVHALHRKQRTQFRYYVLFMANTGLRVGEARLLKWQDISSFKDVDGQTKLKVAVSPDTKTGRGRTVIGMPNAVAYMSEWQQVSEHNSSQDYVWYGQELDATGKALPHTDLNKTFQSFLKSVPYKDRPHGLLKGAGDVNRTLYSLRHFYATQRLIKGDVHVHTLADNMGTGILQIQRHYSHVTPLQKSVELTHVRQLHKSGLDTDEVMELIQAGNEDGTLTAEEVTVLIKATQKISEKQKSQLHASNVHARTQPTPRSKPKGSSKPHKPE